MDGAKVQFSDADEALMRNANIILTKNALQEKIISLLQVTQRKMLNAPVTLSFTTLPPKISKGENYRGLPYMVLDYPRSFQGNNIMIFRTMFWWGNFFSTTLHVSGIFKTECLQKMEGAYTELGDSGFYVGTNADAWQHHFDGDNYAAVNTLTKGGFIQICRNFDHLKIATKLPLEDLNNTGEELLKNWYFLIKLVG
ncbi:MAG: hypothetical protein WKF70_04050 [Chitinophagaceae bacterium]